MIFKCANSDIKTHFKEIEKLLIKVTKLEQHLNFNYQCIYIYIYIIVNKLLMTNGLESNMSRD